MRRAVLAAAFACAASGGSPKGFFAAYCVQCHGAETQMANRRFDTLGPDAEAGDADTVHLLQDAVDQLNLGKMPPKTARLQPTAAERKTITGILTQRIAEGKSKLASTGGQTVLRRLNKREYLNTVADLFRLDLSTFDPASRFPRDQTAARLDNIGDALVTSGYLLDQYLDAAQQVVEKALAAGPRPAEQTWVFDKDFRQQPELDYAHGEVYGFKYLCLYEATDSLRHEGAYGPLRAFKGGVPHDGVYEIRVKAEAMNRRHPYQRAIFQMDPEQPFRLGVVPGNERVGTMHNPQPREPLLAEAVLGDDGPEWHTFRVWLDQGYVPRFTFPNGMIDGRRGFTQIIGRHRDLLPPEQRDALTAIRPVRITTLRYAKMPHIRIHEVRIRGPIHETWPTASYTAVMGSRPFETARTREILERFAARAYRRPPRADEVDRLMAVVDRRRREGKSEFEALKGGLTAALCSPAFLYFDESVPQGAPLNAWALASRLSYFLWSAPPDDELRKAAASGALSKPGALAAQARRLLADRRSDAFVHGFLDGWLNLRALGDMPPDRDAFERYYAHALQGHMLAETRLFARDLLDRNASIVHFLDSDYTFLNRPLALHYGMGDAVDAAAGHQFRRVALTDRHRGGLLGQASVLTVSANGVETSPVVRGIWVLENILGTPPAPPPDNVPTIDPDVRGAKSMREILAKHRDNPGCFACHQKIDPPGFALESFDPVGARRVKYPNGVAIDPSGELADGGKFDDVAGLKRLLLDRKDGFTRMLTERVLAYASGRRMERSDRARVDRLAAELRQRGYGFRDLVELTVESDVFRSK